MEGDIEFEDCACGGNADWYVNGGGFHGMCEDCLKEGPITATLEEAADAWIKMQGAANG